MLLRHSVPSLRDSLELRTLPSAYALG